MEKKAQAGNQELWTRRHAETVEAHREQWAKESQKVSRWKDVTKVFHEAGLHIKEKESFVEEELQEKSEGEDELVTQAEELKCQTEVDTGTKTELQDCLDTWVQICDEADEIHDRKSLQEEELKQCIERHTALWEPTARKNKRF